MHVPAPSQLDGPVNVLVAAAQVAFLHLVPAPYSWQVPATQRPLVPQLAAPLSMQVPVGSLEPVGTFAQVPSLPARLHDLQAELQTVAQHTPCAQTPDPHSVATEHGAPGCFFPQLFRVQTFGATQSVEVVHASKQREPLQANGRQARDVGATHWPVVLHEAAPV
jgi:hypothetical protein